MSDFEDKLNGILSNPDAMGQIMDLARSLGAGKSESSSPQSKPPVQETPPSPVSTDPFSALGNLDPRLFDMAGKLLSAYNSSDDDRAALLSALRPFVKAERYAKLDQAIRISKLTRVIRIALDSFRTKDGGDSLV